MGLVWESEALARVCEGGEGSEGVTGVNKTTSGVRGVRGVFEEARSTGAVPHALSMLSVEGGAASIAVDAVAVRQATRPVAAVPGVRVSNQG